MRSSRSIRWIAVLVLCGVVACSGGADPDDDGPAPRPPSVAAVRVTQGDAQTDVVGALLPLPLVVEAVDGGGAPVAGVTLAFTVASGSGTVTAPRVTTNGEGVASVQWRLGTRAGAQSLAVDVVVGGGTVTLAQATATATPGPAVALALADTSLRYLDPGTTTTLALHAVDAYGNTAPTAGATWSTSAPAVLAVASDGRASALQPGRAEVEARLGSLAITRSLLVRPVAAEDFALPYGVIGLAGAAGRLIVSGWLVLTEWDGSGWRATGLDNNVGFQGIFSVPAVRSDGVACVALAREPFVDRGIACSPGAGAPFVMEGGTSGYIDDLAILDGDRLVAADARNTRRTDGTFSTRVVVERREQGAWRDLAFPATWPLDSMPWGGGSIVAVGDEVWYGDAVGIVTNRRARPLLMHHDGTAWTEIALDGTGGTWVSVERGAGGAVAALVQEHDTPRVFRVQGRTATPVPVSLQLLRGASGLAVSPSGRLALLTPDGVAWETPTGWAEYPFSSGERGVGHNVSGPPPIAWSDEGTLWVATTRGESNAATVKRLRP